MTFSVTEWPKIIMDPTKQEPVCHYQTTILLTHFSWFCVQKCPSNGSINVETPIKILNLKDKWAGKAACWVLWCFKVQIGSSPSLVGGSRGGVMRLQSSEWWLWQGMCSAGVGCTHTVTFQGHLILLTASGIPTQANLQERCEQRARGAHRHTILPSLPLFFVLSACPPPTPAQHSYLHWAGVPLPLCSPPAHPPCPWSWAEEGAEAVGVNEHHRGCSSQRSHTGRPGAHVSPRAVIKGF